MIQTEEKPENNERGWCRVTLFQSKKEKDIHPDYFDEYLLFDGNKWLYWEYSETGCVVVKILYRYE